MVPSIFVRLNELPLTSNGKVDRQRLPSFERIEPEQERGFVSPRTPTEVKLAQIWAHVLNIDRVGVHDNFFEIGGNSLLATKLVFRIQEAFQVELPLPRVFELPSVVELSEVIDDLHLRTSATVDEVVSVMDLNAEAILDPEISPDGISVENIPEPAHILLTGATGFLGSFLLHEFLQETQAYIYCLVRSSNKEDGKKKLQRNLEHYKLWDESQRSRIIPIVGDLSQPLLGLSDQEFQGLTAQIDIIYHSGAWPHFVYSYATLKPTNVQGTQEVLRLACQTKVKPVHYVSTSSVFSPMGTSGLQIIREEDDLVYDGFLYGGYPQSKWVAEKLVRIAGSRGLPVSIYRPGMITGHSQTGVSNLDDLVCRMIKGCLQVGCVADMDLMVNILPVDCVSKAIFHLSREKESTGKCFHLVNPRSMHIDDLINRVRSFGYSIEKVSYEQWRPRTKTY
jgi:thioester reductase-like protein